MTDSAEVKLALLENNQKIIMEQFRQFDENNTKAHEQMLDIFTKLEEKIDKALEKKADVWVEKAVSWAAYTIIGIVLIALVYLVIQK